MPGLAQTFAGAVTLGLPGVYRLPQAQTQRLPEVPMDVTGFAGLAERGPAWQPEPDLGAPEDWRMVEPGRRLRRSVPVLVESFDDYRRQFGEGSGGGKMAGAVRAYFEQGARRAWVVRLLPDRAAPHSLFTDCASGLLEGVTAAGLRLHARNAGLWGDRLTVTLRLGLRRVVPARQEAGLARNELALDASTPVETGDLLLVNGAELLRVEGSDNHPRGRIPGQVRRVRLSAALPAGAVRLERVEAEVSVQEDGIVRETLAGLGLDPAHPRWLATVLAQKSQWIWPDPAWAGAAVALDTAKIGVVFTATFSGGSDAGNSALAPLDNFDASWSPAEEPSERAASGMQALLAVGEVTHVCLPDLYHPVTPTVLHPVLPRPGGTARFLDCTSAPEETPVAPPAVPMLRIDPATAEGRARIVDLQGQMADVCETSGQVIGLLDAPPGLSARQVAAWRESFASPWVALYAPWCRMVRRDNQGGAVEEVPPSAVAAGVIARSEAQGGVARGPANLPAREVVALGDLYPAEALGGLHQAGVNLFTQEAGGIRLQGGRTASHDLYHRQLNVRRMLLRLTRLLREGMQWVVFEPSHPSLWEKVQALLDVVLREEWRRGAFAGASPETSYFIAIDRSQALLDRGELVVSVGVALVEPLEFILLRLTRLGDGTLNLEAAT